MTTIRITKSEFDGFRELQVRKRKDWHAVFSTNFSEETWPFITYGLTPNELRLEVQKRSPILDRVMGIYAELRPERGRVFINHEGAFYSTGRLDGKVKFVSWKCDENLGPQVLRKTVAEASRLAMEELQKKNVSLQKD